MFFKVFRLFDVLAPWIDTRMNESIHIDIEIIDKRVSRIDILRLALDSISQDLRVTHTHPFKEDWNTHSVLYNITRYR